MSVVSYKIYNSAQPLIRSHWKSYRNFIILSEEHINVLQSAPHIQQYFIQPLMRCYWKLISQTAGWRTLNLVFIDHFKKGCIVKRLLTIINNLAKDCNLLIVIKGNYLNFRFSILF